MRLLQNLRERADLEQRLADDRIHIFKTGPVRRFARSASGLRWSKRGYDLMRRVFWGNAKEIIRSTQSADQRIADGERGILAEQARARRTAEAIEITTPVTTIAAIRT
jgi:hypothetical protein